MALGLNKILVTSTSTNTPAAYWQLTTISVASSGNTVVPAGTYLVFPTANVTIEAVSAYNTNTSCTTPNTWTVLLANNTGGVLISDGVNVRANAIVATAATVTVATVNGGQSANSTFTS
jgi:hypothetical protein